ncbi:hypothetical protein N7532_009053 [Penicillium argentinense]|uniref:Uncharacterized protein n=1 Tax=Penicillium argentinense TaxID=1131581 RepID=A0A9W9EYQ3_9EURO|nr:uncharacterized protein N7532_009053 [Penicillium argentinense]KAJ5090369.1 hypothetical protein N7532_009053 [Penicillium argentinense]
MPLPSTEHLPLPESCKYICHNSDGTSHSLSIARNILLILNAKGYGPINMRPPIWLSFSSWVPYIKPIHYFLKSSWAPIEESGFRL